MATRVPTLGCYYDWGDAGGCPPYGSCNNGWTQGDVWYISWGASPSWPLPLIYNTVGANADQWYNLSLYSYLNHGGRMDIRGSGTEYQACQQRDYCSGIDNTPAQGWTQLWTALNNDSRTAQSLRWSTDVKWLQ